MALLKNSWLITIGLLFILLNSWLIFAKDIYFLNLLPLALLVIYAGLFSLDKLFLFIVFCTPLSLNLEQLSLGGIGLYLPTEPILLGLMMVFLFKQIKGSVKSDYRVFTHPISLILLFQLAWIFITSLTSELPIVSFKYLLSRMWFVVPCYFFGIWFFRAKIENIYRFLWAYMIPLAFVLLFTVIKHASYGFSEETGHWIMSPFFKDHTSYGAIIALFYPIVVSLLFNPKYNFVTKSLLAFILLIFTIALFYSYTRAAWLSVVAAGMVYLLFVFKIRFKYLFVTGMLVGSFVLINWTELSYMLQKNNAEHTTENFGERLQSMSNVSSDASNLERLNRWNSAMRLFKERPLVGWGPGTYSFVYAPFQDPADLTIISTNFGDGGNAHSEYLGPLAEQGVPGMLIMVLLVGFIFYKASILYIQLDDPELKRLVMMVMLALVTYFTHGVLNNYLDTDKASVPVWGMTAIIVAIELYYKEKKSNFC